MEIPNALDRSSLMREASPQRAVSLTGGASAGRGSGPANGVTRARAGSGSRDVDGFQRVSRAFGRTTLAKLAGTLGNLAHRIAVRETAFSRSVGGASKRILDILVSVSAIILLSPVMLVVAAASLMQNGRPLIIAHPRVGFEGRVFRCFKFRTMIVDAEAALEAHLAADPEAAREWRETQKLRNDPRVTRLGRFLRKTSLDELPQLFNVLMGDMSCVGPRPIVSDELQRYGRQSRHYLRSRPGLTGLWQVSGRSSASYRRRVAMDTYYVTHWSFARDAWLLVMTVPAMLKTDDAA